MTMKTMRNDWALPIKMVCLIVFVLFGTVPVFVAEAQTTRRVVAVYQFNSVIPEISGPVARELFIAALVRSGKFAIAPPNAAGA
jgi:multidrug resistance efflux pump